MINFSSAQVGYGQNEFTKRVGFSVTMPSANLSFYINDTQESDSGLYVCIVIIPGAPTISGQIQLNVKGNGAECRSHFKGCVLSRRSAGLLTCSPLKIGKSRTRFTGSVKITVTVRAKTERRDWSSGERDEVTAHLCCLQWIKPEVQVPRWVTAPILSSDTPCVSPQSRPLLPSAA